MQKQEQMETLWVGQHQESGRWYVNMPNEYRRRLLNANGEQIHNALSQNGWVRVAYPEGESTGVRGTYAHSHNWPLFQQHEPLKQFYA